MNCTWGLVTSAYNCLCMYMVPPLMLLAVPTYLSCCRKPLPSPLCHTSSYPVFTLLDIHQNEQLELKTKTTQISKTQPTLQIQTVTALYKDFVMRKASHHSLKGETKCRLTSRYNFSYGLYLNWLTIYPVKTV